MNAKYIVKIVFVMMLTASYQNVAVAKNAYLDSCSGDELPHNTAKKACNSGDYPGETVVTCSNKGKEKDKRLCNSDGKKNGVYLGNCSGTSTGYTNLKKACQSENYLGALLVDCKKGEEKKRMQCEAAEEDDAKIAIFKDRCGSAETISGNNLKKACKNNPGETLVKCKKKQNVWKENKSMFCQGTRDRFKFNNCSPDEREMLISDYEIAEERVDLVLGELESELQTNQDMDSSLRKKMETVRKKMEKIQTAMDRPRTYVCKANKNLCSGAVAHTLPTGKKVKVCTSYFDKPESLERASILIHEISHHETQTTDKGSEHGGCLNPNLSRAANKFHRQAELETINNAFFDRRY